MSRVLIIPFFIPHMGCPFKCVFCNQWSIIGNSIEKQEDVPAKVKEVLSTVKSLPERVEVAFFGGSFTGLPEEQQLHWLKQAYELKKAGLITGLRLSTRPDYISHEILRRLEKYGVNTIELGVQSLVDEVLDRSARGHCAEQTYQATRLIREYPFELIYQIMLGLPGDNAETTLFTAKKTVEMRPDGVRIYPAVVIKDTALAEAYAQGLFEPWSLQATIETGKNLLGLFLCHGIKVIRMGLQATESLTSETDLVAGPYHPAYRELVENELMLEQIISAVEGQNFQNGKIRIIFNKQDYSKVVGQKRGNMRKLKTVFPAATFELMPDSKVPNDDIFIEFENSRLYCPRQEFLSKYRIVD